MGILGNMFSDFKRGWDEGRQESQIQDYDDVPEEDEYYDQQEDDADVDEAFDEINQILDNDDWQRSGMDVYQRLLNLSDTISSAAPEKSLYVKALAYHNMALQSCTDFYAEHSFSEIEEKRPLFVENAKECEKWNQMAISCLDRAVDGYVNLQDFGSARVCLQRKCAILEDVDGELTHPYPEDELVEMKSMEERRRLALFLLNSPESWISEFAREEYSKVTEKLMDDDYNFYETILEEDIHEFIHLAFASKPFSERHFVFFAGSVEDLAGYYDWGQNIRHLFTIDQYPHEMEFPVGHPQANTLYVAHPVRKGYYLPYDGAEDRVFQDKVDDFIRLVQCLGATEISFRSLSGRSVSETFNSGYEGGLDYRGITRNANLGSEGSASGDYSRNTSKEIGHSRRFDPVRPPYCPDDIKWLEYDPSWQSLVKQRLDGNILEYTMRISSEDAMSTNSSQKMSLKVSYEGLMRNVDAHFNAERDTTFSTSESTLWEISVVFKSLKDFSVENDAKQVAAIEVPETENVPEPELTDAEHMYLEELNFMLEDGAIGDAERRLLERKRLKFGISEDRAAELEAMVAPSLTDDEIEYIETFKEICADGEVTPRMRKMLDREAAGLGISSERAVELEAIASEQ